jgi:hypothetical protein
VLVEIPGEKAHAVFALVKISQEYRHNGLIVTNIGPASQGARAGMARGDVLLRYAGVELDSAGTLRHLIKRHTQGAELSKTVIVEAVRGSEDLSFEVCGGRLGITVCSSLYGWKRVRGSRTKPQEADRKEADAGKTLAVIRTPEDAQRHDPGKPALVEIPGELVRKVLSLVKTLAETGPSKRKKLAKAVLSRRGPKQDRR